MERYRSNDHLCSWSIKLSKLFSACTLHVGANGAASRRSCSCKPQPDTASSSKSSATWRNEWLQEGSRTEELSLEMVHAEFNPSEVPQLREGIFLTFDRSVLELARILCLALTQGSELSRTISVQYFTTSIINRLPFLLCLIKFSNMMDPLVLQ